MKIYGEIDLFFKNKQQNLRDNQADMLKKLKSAVNPADTSISSRGQQCYNMGTAQDKEQKRK